MIRFPSTLAQPLSSTRIRRVPVVVTVVTLGIFAAFVAVVTLRLRAHLHDQVLSREAESLLAVVRLQQRLAEEEWMRLGLTQPSDDRFSTLLLTTRLRGVLSLRLYEPTGQLREALPAVSDAMLPLSDWFRLERGEAFARLGAHQPVLDLIDGRDPVEATETGPPVLEVIVPLEEPLLHELGGAAQYLMDGQPVQDELAEVDRGLVQQAVLAVAGGGVVIVALLVWAFSRLGEARRELESRSEDLARANQELLFAAKTSAVGAISAHLIHGLKNPLAGLEGFVKAGPTSHAGGNDGGDAWQVAAETTRRLRALINEVVVVLRDETVGGTLVLTAQEVAEHVCEDVRADAERAGVNLQVKVLGGGDLDGRTANLAGLVLRNLVTNAIEASRTGQQVTLTVAAGSTTIEYEVMDQGPGLPDEVRRALFQPLHSSKPGGGGIGLALSHQLARHAGGQLELMASVPGGSTFRLTLPRKG
ncbi:MAG: HAMP domain-containing histidine kinase [Opitutaceae bacterium]|nr:HAMP domain-containing histidine kinase [Opitutaceae bacterium]